MRSATVRKTQLKRLESLVAHRKMLAFIDAALDHKKKQLLVQQQAWNSALEQLETEIVKAKSGIDLSTLLRD